MMLDFLFLVISLVFGLYPGKCLKFNQSEWRVAYAEFQAANQKSGNLKFYTPFNKRTFIGRNPVGISKKGKDRIKQKSKCPLWIFRLRDRY